MDATIEYNNQIKQKVEQPVVSDSMYSAAYVSYDEPKETTKTPKK